jgi:tetratricopeptide (TPR) repeat protein
MARGKEKAPSGAPPSNVVPIGAARRRGVVGSAPSDASATDALDKALKAKTPDARIRHARAGLARHCEDDTKALLLRQLYLGLLETERFDKARIAAEQMIELGLMPDVARHDAARACQACGDFDAAVEHLRVAARVGPKERRSFHLSTLGGLLYAIGRPAEAIEPLQTAVDDHGAPAALLQGQLALARRDEGELDLAYHDLANDPAGEGYGRFVLGELAFARGDRQRARVHLESFLSRTRRARPAARAALAPEIARAEATLGRIVLN